MEMIHLSKYSDNFSSNQHYSCRKFEIKSTMIRLVLKMYFNLRELGNNCEKLDIIIIWGLFVRKWNVF